MEIMYSKEHNRHLFNVNKHKEILKNIEILTHNLNILHAPRFEKGTFKSLKYELFNNLNTEKQIINRKKSEIKNRIQLYYTLLLEFRNGA